MTQSKLGFSLFWRTYALLVMLLLGGVFAWLQALRELDIEPRAVTASAQQMVTVVQLSGEALRLSDRANRPATLKALATRQGLVLQPRSATRLHWMVSSRQARGTTSQPRRSAGARTLLADPA